MAGANNEFESVQVYCGQLLPGETAKLGFGNHGLGHTLAYQLQAE